MCLVEEKLSESKGLLQQEGKENSFICLERNETRERKMQSSPSGQHFPFLPNWKEIERKENLYQSMRIFFPFLSPLQTNTLNARYSHFIFLLFVSTLDFFFLPPSIFPNIKSLTPCKINVLKLLTRNFNLVICNHEKRLQTIIKK